MLPATVTILNKTHGQRHMELLKGTDELTTSYNDTDTGKFHSFKVAGDKALPQDWESNASCFSSFLGQAHKRDGMRKQ